MFSNTQQFLPGYSSATYINSIRQQWSHHYIVTGLGGARTDFISQFMANQPQYFNHWAKPWSVALLTKASGPAECLFIEGETDCDINNPDVEQKLMKYYDNTALWTVSKSHCHIHNIVKNIPVQHSRLFTVVSITINPKEVDQITDVAWDMLYKCWLAPIMFKNPSYKIISDLAKQQGYIANQCEVSSLPVDEIASLVERLGRDWYIQCILNDKANNNPTNVGDINLISLPYVYARAYDGGEGLARLLNIQISDDAKATWNDNMKKAESPQNLICLGRHWSRAQVYEWVQNELQRTNN